jgi:hypothetical protein
MKGSKALVLAIAAALLVGAGTLAWLVAGDPISQAKWDQIQKGMSKEQVIKVMGAPKSDYGDQIVYSRPLNAGWVAFAFDTNGVVAWKNDESVFGSLK